MPPATFIYAVLVILLSFFDSFSQLRVTKIAAPDRQRYDRFGLAIHHQTPHLYIGAPERDMRFLGKDAIIDAGGVYIYNKLSGFKFQELITSPDTTAQANFGRSIATIQDLLLIGAPLATNNQKRHAGKVFCYQLDTKTKQYHLIKEIYPDTIQSNTWFGYKIQAVDSLIAITAPITDNFNGKVYLYRLTADKQIVLYQTISPPQVQTGQEFGSAICLSANRLIISAPKTDIPDFTDAGIVYCYQRKDHYYLPVATLSPPYPQSFLYFGSSLALWHNRLCVAADGYDNLATGKTDCGAIGIYQTNELSRPMQWLTDALANGFDRLGYALTCIDGKLLAGAPGPGNHNNTYFDNQHTAGSVLSWQFDIDLQQFVFRQRFRAADGKAGDSFGCALTAGKNFLSVGAYRAGEPIPGDELLPDSGIVYWFE